MDANFYETLKIITDARKSIREFDTTLIASDVIEKIKSIAYTSPYASGKKYWDIITVDDKNLIKEISNIIRKKVDDLTLNIRDDFRDGFREYAKNFTAFESASLLFIPVFRISPSISLMLNSPDDTIKQYERDNHIKSISCVAMLIILAAQSLGLGSCYMTGPLFAEEEIKNILSIKKERNIGAVIPVGFPLNRGI